ncbi:HAMP domain-containing sensor histidine kinase [Haloarcula sp. Atlit-120R]|uniref:sensor histidine kinase n=1 Tax=Haloarcula sp. Atlit-120R TaxID=2282135 RepID=UPI000EF19F20|nr:GAF domain-containing sensor histidine kinase [Haloarcula sp. Atlit-120R]RLM37083.1 histidine kinase [Haloarcula sp. Atlit-120R]
MGGELTVTFDLDSFEAVTRQLMAAESEREICEIAMSEISSVFDLPLGALWLYDSDATELQLAASTERADEVFDWPVTYRPGNSLSWEAFEQDEVRTYSELDDEQRQYNENSPVSSEIILPLTEYGVINIGSLTPVTFDDETVRLARMYATHVQAALQKAEREHDLRVQRDRMEQFIGVVSHDLRNPLHVVEGRIELVRESGDLSHLDDAAEGVARMESLINDLLTLAKEGYAVEDRTAISLDTIVEQTWEMARTADATLQIEGSAPVFGDQNRLKQVFENLFRNAADHAGDDVTVWVGPLVDSGAADIGSADARNEGRVIGFYVADDGPGISPDKLNDLLSVDALSGSDSGLGLSIVAQITDAHGWDISVTESRAGGARFEVTDGTKPVSPFHSS